MFLSVFPATKATPKTTETGNQSFMVFGCVILFCFRVFWNPTPPPPKQKKTKQYSQIQKGESSGCKQGRALYGPIPVKTETFGELWAPLVHTNFGGNSYGPIIGPYLFLGKFVWTNGPENSSKVSPYTGVGPWMALPSAKPKPNEKNKPKNGKGYVAVGQFWCSWGFCLMIYLYLSKIFIFLQFRGTKDRS